MSRTELFGNATSSASSSPSSQSDASHSPGKTTSVAEPIRLAQFVQDVLDYSSQYGSNDSISFTAFNITGAPSKYPEYGDFPETFAMRTYGNWWQNAPSREHEIMPQTIPEVVSQDYIIVHFEDYVLPEKVSIFETYNPGSVVQIWAFSINGEWNLLWQHPPQVVARSQRIFSPPLRKMVEPTSILRLDFNHSLLDYYAEIDAVMLTGVKMAISYNIFRPLELKSGWIRGRIQRRLDKVRFQPKPNSPETDPGTILNELLTNGLDEFIIKETSSESNTNTASTSLQYLPYEILIKICGYLDIVTLFRLAETCRLMRDVSCDPILYTELNLRPYWNMVNESCLYTFQNRCRLLKKLDLSWCGSASGLESEHFDDFIGSCGRQLTHLRLKSVNFLILDCIYAIANNCEHLKELTLRNYSHAYDVTPNILSSLRHLERLDLYRTSFTTATLVALVQQNPKLKHLNLGQINSFVNMDEVAWHLPTSCKQLVSIDLWKTHGLTAIGLTALANCTQLQEAELGWCMRQEPAPGDSLVILLKECVSLQKLGLASMRGLTADDLDAIAMYCHNIEQLDLMGIMGMTTDHCTKILQQCKRLKMLDISFCDNIGDLEINYFRSTFPVDIKRDVRSEHDVD